MDDGRGRFGRSRFRRTGLILSATFCGVAMGGVGVPPEFVEQPAGVTVCGGQTAAFSVRVDFHDSSTLALRWEYHDGSAFVPLSHGDRAGRVVIVRNLSDPASATSTLTLNDADPEIDAGDYRCVADGGDGSPVVSDLAPLVVHAALDVVPTAGDEGIDDDSVCIGQPIQLMANPSGGDAGQQSFVWRILSGPDIGAAQFAPNAGVEDAQFTPTAEGTYHIEVEVNDSVCASSVSGVVIVNANVVLTVEPSPEAAATCLDDPVSLVANPAGGSTGYSFVWSITNLPDGAVGTFDDPALASPKFTPTAAVVGETFVVQVILSGDGCADSDSASVSVTVIDEPTVESIIADDSQVCLGDATRLHVTAGGGDGNYTHLWSVDSGPSVSTSQFSDLSSTAPLFAPALAGDYTLKVSVGSGFCTPVEDTIEITTHVAPSLSATISEATICVGDSVNLTANETGSGQQFFTWTVVAGPDSDSVQFSDPSANNPTFTPAASGVYELRVLLDDSLCNAFAVDTVALTVNAVVNAAPAAAVTNGCVGSPIELSANPSGGIEAYTFAWSVGSGPNLSSSQFDDTTSETPTFTPTNATSVQDYVLRLVVADGVCASEEPVYFLTVSVSELLVLEPTVDDDPALLGRATLLRANPSGGHDANYTWSVAASPDECADDPFADADTGSETATFTPQCEGKYVVSVIADDGVCDVATDSLSIQVIDYAAAPSAEPASICSSDVTILSPNVTPGFGVHSYAWSIVRQPASGDGLIDVPSSENPTLTATVVGTYGILVEVEDDVLPTIAGEVDVRVVDDTPTIDVGPPDPATISACVGEDVELVVEASGSVLTYQWRRNGFDINGATDATLSLTDVGESDTAAYTCLVTNPCDSVESDPFLVEVDPADPLPTLYGVTRDAVLWNVPAGCTIDGDLVEIGIMPEEILRVTALAANTDTGVLYAAVRTSLTPISSLATVDVNTGATAVIGSMGEAISDLAFNPVDGNLYAIHGNRSPTPGTVVTVDVSDASLTFTAIPPFGDEEGSSIAFDEQGTLYYHGRVFGQYSRLRSVDLSDPTVVNVLHDYETQAEWSAMAIHNDLFLAASRSTFELWSIDRNTYEATVLDTTTTPDGEDVWLMGMSFLADAPVLQLSIADDPDPVPPGGMLIYTLTVANTGLRTATDVVLQGRVPEATTYLSERFVEGQGQSFPPPVGQDGAITWSFSDPLTPTEFGGDPEDGAFFRVELVVLVDPSTPEGTEITHDAFQIESTETGVLQLDVHEATTVQTAAAVVATLSADTVPPGGDPPGVGGLLRYDATIVNHGPPLADVDFLVTLDPNASIVSGSVVTEGVVITESPVHVTFGQLGTEESTTITFDVSVNAGMPMDTVICHQGIVTLSTTSEIRSDDPATPEAIDATCHAVCGAGDIDCNSTLDLTDYNLLQSCTRGPSTPPPFDDCLTFDLDGDGDVDLIDWSMFQSRF